MTPAKRGSSPLTKLRRLALAIAEAHEVEAWGTPTFRVRNKLFAMYASADDHHGAGRPAVWCKAGPGIQELMIKANPDRFFKPPYVGPSGWVGIHLDGQVSWTEVGEFLRDAYDLTVPKPRARSAAPRRTTQTSPAGGPARVSRKRASPSRSGKAAR